MSPVGNKSSEETREVPSQLITEKDLFGLLKERVDKLDAIVISGGEPTLHKDLPDFIKKINEIKKVCVFIFF